MVHGGVFITGAASGIGRAWALRLAKKNYGITVVDLDLEGAEKTVDMIKAMGGQAQSIKCDLTSYVDQKHAFEAHIREFSTLDFAILNAGVPEQGDFLDPQNHSWIFP
ncbi:hypothetical protein WJX84_010746 [Apatococcus fuscideae]|uniref:Uncharacterized protein n=1 Tax=Apatococcus fuscideae TaxID=2026836 RepID=A0AAW1SAN7_9CHLO